MKLFFLSANDVQERLRGLLPADPNVPLNIRSTPLRGSPPPSFAHTKHFQLAQMQQV